MSGVRPSVAFEYLVDCISVGLVPMLWGSPGIGKSDIYKRVADVFNLALIDLRLVDYEPQDLTGFPGITDDFRTQFAPMRRIPIKGDKVPEGKDGWLLLLDELPGAAPATQKSAYKILLDRMVGEVELHPAVKVGAAGNLETDGAFTNSMSTASQSRMVHIELQVSSQDWLEWAIRNKIDYRITAYIGWKPNSLHIFDPDHNDKTFACPRTWKMLSDLIKQWKEVSLEKTTLMQGVVSEGVAREFVNFLRVFNELTPLSKIIADPLNANVPSQPGTLYAISSVIADNVNADNVDSLLAYVNRIPKEFQIITIKDMSKRYPLVEAHPKFIEKLVEVASLL